MDIVRGNDEPRVPHAEGFGEGVDDFGPAEPHD
jgi:hypothetical protein